MNSSAIIAMVHECVFKQSGPESDGLVATVAGGFTPLAAYLPLLWGDKPALVGGLQLHFGGRTGAGDHSEDRQGGDHQPW